MELRTKAPTANLNEQETAILHALLGILQIDLCEEVALLLSESRGAGLFEELTAESVDRLTDKMFYALSEHFDA